MAHSDSPEIRAKAEEIFQQMKIATEKAGNKVNTDLWNAPLLWKVSRYIARQAIGDPHDDEVSIDSEGDVRDSIDLYYSYRDSIKPCVYESDRRAGSLQRLMRYIELKRELARTGLELSPASNLRFEQKQHGSNPFKDSEVVELTVTFLNKKPNLGTSVFSYGEILRNQSLAKTLRQIADLVEVDIPHQDNEIVHAEINAYTDANSWKMERIMGDKWAASELLDGFPQVSESFTSKGPGRDPVLIINDPDIPPRELARIYDDIYVTKKVNAVNSRHWFGALDRAKEDLNTLTTDDYLEHFWATVPSLLERDRPPEGYTDETMGEKLRSYMPSVFNAYREQRLRELKNHRLSQLQPEKVDESIRAQKGSAKRPPPPSLDQEILGRLAFDTCLENIWFEDGETFLQKVWSKYREWASSLEDETAAKLKVKLGYYDKPNSETPDLQKIRTNIRKLERSIHQRLGLSSPFRRSQETR